MELNKNIDYTPKPKPMDPKIEIGPEARGPRVFLN